MNSNQSSFFSLFLKCLFLVCSIYLFMSRIRLGTLNLNGAQDSKKRAMLYDLTKEKKIDVMLVQETQ